MTKNTTAKLRVMFAVLFVVVVLASVVGWMFFDRSPGELSVVIGWVAGAVGIGEASNIGKRATFNRDAVGDA